MITPLSSRNYGLYWDLFSHIIPYWHPTTIQRTGHTVRKLPALLDSISVRLETLSILWVQHLHLALRCTYSRTHRTPKGSFHNNATLWVGSPSTNTSQLVENKLFNYPPLGVLYVPSSRSLPTRPTRLGVLIVTGGASGHLPRNYQGGPQFAGSSC